VIKKHIRILSSDHLLDTEMKKLNAPVLIAFLDAHIKDMEYRLRYAATEETKVIQGSLRTLDDIRDLLRTS